MKPIKNDPLFAGMRAQILGVPGKGYLLVRAQAAEGDKPASGSATMYVYDVIGFDFWSGGGLTAQRVIDDLKALGGVDLAVRINSPGGDVFDGIAIFNALARYPGKVTVHIDGVAASIASVIAMAGEKILIAENAMVMVHQPSTVAVGDATEMRRCADMLDKCWSAILATYATRTGRRAEKIAQNVIDASGEWWMTAEEAVKERFADESVKPAKDAPQAFGLKGFKRVPERLAAAAGPEGSVRVPQPPAIAEIAQPRVRVVSPPTSSSSASRRRALDVLRLST